MLFRSGTEKEFEASREKAKAVAETCPEGDKESKETICRQSTALSTLEQVELDFDSIGAAAEKREELLTERREWQSLSAQKLVTAVDRARTQVETTRQHRDSEIKDQQAFSSGCIIGTVAVRDPAATAVNPRCTLQA